MLTVDTPYPIPISIACETRSLATSSVRATAHSNGTLAGKIWQGDPSVALTYPLLVASTTNWPADSARVRFRGPSITLSGLLVVVASAAEISLTPAWERRRTNGPLPSTRSAEGDMQSRIEPQVLQTSQGRMVVPGASRA